MINAEQAQAIEREANELPLEIGFKRLSENATLPTKAHVNDSGFDVFAAADVVIEPGETVVVPTDIAVVLPKGYDAYIKNRSGVASKTKLRVVSPPIDEGYRGAIGIILDNIAEDACGNEMQYLTHIDGLDYRTDSELYPNGTYLIRKGDKLAQLVVQPRPNTVAVEITGDLDETDRGDKGYGSSGVR